MAEQAAAVIREDIHRGVWSGLLPSETELAAHLKISRPSVHAALIALQNEGLLGMGHGRLARVVPGHRPRNSPSMVCVLMPYARSKSSLVEEPLLLKLRAELLKAEIGWEAIYDARLARGGFGDHLRKLVAARRNVCWVTAAPSSAALQRWLFAAKVPAFVLGSCPPGVHLPSVDSNYHAAAWHAAATIARFGHKSIVVVLPNSVAPGDIASRNGIVDHIAKMGGKITVTELEASPSPAGLGVKLDRVMARRPRPTAIFTMRADVGLAVLYQLQRAGLRVPDDVSLVCRDSHEMIEAGIPEFTRYHSSMDRLVRASARIIRLLLKGNSVPPVPTLITPTYIAGETLSFPASEAKPSVRVAI